MQSKINSGTGLLLSLVLAASLASCGAPTDKGEAVTLPAGAAANDSVKASLTTPALDATSTTADSSAGRTAVTPR